MFPSECSNFVGAVAKYMEWNLTYADITQNEI